MKIVFFAVKEEDMVGGMPVYARAILISVNEMLEKI